MALPVVVVELNLHDHDIRYYSDNPYADYTAGVVSDPRLGNEISFERKITTIFWGGGRSRVGLGAIELINTDGSLDELLAQLWRDRPVRIWLGDDATDWGDMTLAASGVVDRIESIGESRLRLVVADASAVFDRPIKTTTYTTGDQQGRQMPLLIGSCLSIPALATEVANLRFAIHNVTGSAIFTVRDQGVALTASTQWQAYDTAPTFGFRLLQSTAGRIVADAQAPVASGSGASFGAEVRSVLRAVMLHSGHTNYSQSQFDALNSTYGGVFSAWMGRYVDGSNTYRQVLDGIADSIGGWWYVDQTNQFQIGQLLMPSGTPALAITEIQLVGEVEIEFDSAPGLTDVLAAIRNWHVHSPEELAGSVRDTALGVSLTKDYRYRTSFTVYEAYSSSESSAGGQRESQVTTWVRKSAESANAGNTRPESDYGQGTLWTETAAANTEATRRATLWDGPRWWYRCAVEMSVTDAATLALHSVVSLTVTDERTSLPRFELDGRLLRVIGVRGVLGQGRVQLTLWGDGPEPEA